MNRFSMFLPTKVRIGIGVHKELPTYIKGEAKALIVTDKGLVETGVAAIVEKILREAGHQVDMFDRVTPNPDEDLVKETTAFIKEKGSTHIIGLGGGSAIDTAKVGACMAANEGPLEDYQWNGRSFEKAPLPLFAVPTTAGTGSEVTGVAVITSRNTKKGVADRYIFPEVALVDPELMRSLPPYVTAITGMDALTHAIEAYIGLGANEITDSLSERAIELIGTYLPKAYANGNDMEARYYMAVASTMAGIAMDQAGLGIVHAMASPVCAYLHYSHGFANAFLLPYGMEFNVIARKDKLACVSKLLGESTEFMTVDKAAWSSIERVRLLLDELDLSDKISAEISTSSDVDVDIFAKATANMFLARNNPRIVTVDQCKKIFEEIFFGD